MAHADGDEAGTEASVELYDAITNSPRSGSASRDDEGAEEAEAGVAAAPPAASSSSEEKAPRTKWWPWLLLALAIVGLAVGLGVGLGTRSSEDEAKQYDACIVGAGWAGLRAAQTLLDEGYTNIVVLEAQEYVGGRSKTVNADGSINVPNPSDVSRAPLDLGSEWLYIEGNEMEDHLRRNGLLDGIDLGDRAYYVPAMYGADDQSAYYRQYVQADGALATERMPTEEVKGLHRWWDKFLGYRYNKFLSRGRDANYVRAVKRFIRRENLTEDQNLKLLQYLILYLAMGEVDYGGDASKLSLAGIEYGDGEYDPSRYMSVPGVGFGNTAATFAAPFSSVIELGSKVSEINHEDPNNVVVSFTKDGVSRRLSSRTVLVTVPLGVLKAGTVSFQPSLPAYKQEVIEKMGFGVFNKCAMQWDEAADAVWADEEWFELMTPGEPSSQKWTTFYNPTKRKGIPTLVGFIGGKDAAAIESQTDEEVLDDVMTNLRAMFPDITRPDRVVISRWGKEENARGVYTFKTVGRDFVDDSQKLRRRVGNVFFAGEATSDGWYGSTVGAWESGEEAAEDMIDEMNS